MSSFKLLKKNTLVLLLLFVFCYSLGQQKAKLDSLRQWLDQKINDSSKLKVLVQLSNLYDGINTDSSFYFGRQALKLSQGLGDEPGIGLSNFALGNRYMTKGDLDSSEYFFLKSLESFKKLKNDDGASNVMYNLGLLNEYKGQYDSALTYYQKDLEHQIQKKDTLKIADCYLNLGAVYNGIGSTQVAHDYFIKARDFFVISKDTLSAAKTDVNLGNIQFDVGNYDLAIQNYFDALSFFELGDQQLLKAIALKNIGGTYEKLKEYDNALRYYNEALDIFIEQQHNYRISSTYNSLASLFYKAGNRDSAKLYFEKSKVINDTYQYDEILAMNMKGLSTIAFDRKEYPTALNYQLRDIELKERSGKSGHTIATSYNELGKIYMTMGNFSEAERSLKKALVLIQDSENKEVKKSIFYSLYDFFHRQNQLDKAIQYLEKHNTLSDSLFTEKIAKNVIAQEIQYQTAKKDQEIILQKAQLTAQQSIIQQQSLERNLLMGGVASAIIILILLVYTYSNRLKVKELVNKNQRETEALRSRFFANISHEFRTPLALITARTDDLTENGREQDQADLLGIKKNTTRLLQLVNQLLDLSRIDAGRLALKARQGDLAHFTKALIESFQSLALQRDITFSLEMDEGAIEGYFDQDQFEKVVVNLVSNAFKNTPGGGEISVSAYLEGSKEFILSVKDTGRGIPREDIKHIFDRFYQTSDSEGSGIGLSLTKELVELYHGTVEVESELGKGSTFTVKLPIDFDSMKELGVEILAGTPVISKTGHLSASLTAEDRTDTQQLILPENRDTILVVEDNTELRKYMADFLADEYQVIEASHGKAGLELAIKYQPDMILSDVMMPEMEGTELCKRIKNTTETSHIPFIMLTAKASGQDKLEGLNLGADDYLVKPFDKKELKTRVKNLVLQRKKLIEKFSQSLNPRDIKLNSADEKFLSQASAMVREYIDDSSFSVEAFSKAIGMSRTQLFRKIRGLTGMSVSEYMRAIRLNLAAEKLKNKTASVSEIAYEVGFNNLSYFTKCFKERFGVKPSQYA